MAGIQMLTQLINAKKRKESYVCYAKSIVFIFALSLLFVQQMTGIPFSPQCLDFLCTYFLL